MSAKSCVHTFTQNPVHTSVYSNKSPGTVENKGLEGCLALYTLGRVLYDMILEVIFLIYVVMRVFSTRVRLNVVCTVCTVCTGIHKHRYINGYKRFNPYTLPYTPCTHLD